LVYSTHVFSPELCVTSQSHLCMLLMSVMSCVHVTLPSVLELQTAPAHGGRAIVQAIGRSSLTANVRSRSQDIPCGICGREVALRQVTLPVSSPCSRLICVSAATDGIVKYTSDMQWPIGCTVYCVEIG